MSILERVLGISQRPSRNGSPFSRAPAEVFNPNEVDPAVLEDGHAPPTPIVATVPPPRNRPQSVDLGNLNRGHNAVAPLPISNSMQSIDLGTPPSRVPAIAAAAAPRLPSNIIPKVDLSALPRGQVPPPAPNFTPGEFPASFDFHDPAAATPFQIKNSTREDGKFRYSAGGVIFDATNIDTTPPQTSPTHEAQLPGYTARIPGYEPKPSSYERKKPGSFLRHVPPSVGRGQRAIKPRSFAQGAAADPRVAGDGITSKGFAIKGVAQRATLVKPPMISYRLSDDSFSYESEPESEDGDEDEESSESQGQSENSALPSSTRSGVRFVEPTDEPDLQTPRIPGQQHSASSIPHNYWVDLAPEPDFLRRAANAILAQGSEERAQRRARTLALSTSTARAELVVLANSMLVDVVRSQNLLIEALRLPLTDPRHQRALAAFNERRDLHDDIIQMPPPQTPPRRVPVQKHQNPWLPNPFDLQTQRFAHEPAKAQQAQQLKILHPGPAQQVDIFNDAVTRAQKAKRAAAAEQKALPPQSWQKSDPTKYAPTPKHVAVVGAKNAAVKDNSASKVALARPPLAAKGPLRIRNGEPSFPSSSRAPFAQPRLVRKPVPPPADPQGLLVNLGRAGGPQVGKQKGKQRPEQKRKEKGDNVLSPLGFDGLKNMSRLDQTGTSGAFAEDYNDKRFVSAGLNRRLAEELAYEARLAEELDFETELDEYEEAEPHGKGLYELYGPIRSKLFRDMDAILEGTYDGHFVPGQGNNVRSRYLSGQSYQQAQHAPQMPNNPHRLPIRKGTSYNKDEDGEKVKRQIEQTMREPIRLLGGLDGANEKEAMKEERMETSGVRKARADAMQATEELLAFQRGRTSDQLRGFIEAELRGAREQTREQWRRSRERIFKSKGKAEEIETSQERDEEVRKEPEEVKRRRMQISEDDESDDVLESAGSSRSSKLSILKRVEQEESRPPGKTLADEGIVSAGNSETF